MKKMLETLRALEQLGAAWKARRATKRIAFDTVECTTLLQTDEGVIKGLVEVQRQESCRCTKIEVVCYLGGCLKKDGRFDGGKHSKNKIAKLFEHDSEVLYRSSKVFGVWLGWRPVGVVSAEHQFLADFADRLIAETGAIQKATGDEEKAVAEERRRENEKTARRALFRGTGLFNFACSGGL